MAAYAIFVVDIRDMDQSLKAMREACGSTRTVSVEGLP
jgi:hypothetical protein